MVGKTLNSAHKLFELSVPQLKLSRHVQNLRGVIQQSKYFASNVDIDSLPPKSRAIIERESKVLCPNYAPVPAVISSGKGVLVQDVDGKEYFDFLSGYSTTNQGHCHPKIIKALTDQAGILHHTSRAFHNNVLVEYGEFITKLFGYVRTRIEITSVNQFLIIAGQSSGNEHRRGSC